MKGALQTRDVPLVRQSLYRFDTSPGNAVSQRTACQSRLIVHQNRAGTALATVAALLGAGQAEHLTQIVNQQHVVGHRVFTRSAIHRNAEYCFHTVSSEIFQLFAGITTHGQQSEKLLDAQSFAA
jgi:hypothetical protein